MGSYLSAEQIQQFEQDGFVRVDDVLVCRPYDPAVAFKITLRRPVSSGDIEDRDVYGCQQHVPLTSIEI